MLTYNFENPIFTLTKCRKNDLAVVETEGYESADASGRRRKQLFETMYEGGK